MVSTTERISPRELLRYLPDLLAGNEPVLSGATVDAFLKEHPEARAPLMLAAGMTYAMRAGQERLRVLPPVLPREFWKPVDQARRLLADRLMPVLHDTALWYLDVATKDSDTFILNVNDVDWPDPDPDGIEWTAERLADELGLGASPFVLDGMRDALEALRRPTPADARQVAKDVMAACDRLVPGHEWVRFHGLMLRHAGLSEWLGLAANATSHVIRGCAFHEAARAATDDGRPFFALRLSRKAGTVLDPIASSWHESWQAASLGLWHVAVDQAERFAAAYRDAGARRKAEFRRIARTQLSRLRGSPAKNLESVLERLPADLANAGELS